MNAHISNWKTLLEVTGVFALLAGEIDRPGSGNPEQAVQAAAKIHSLVVGTDSTISSVRGSGVFVSADGFLLTNFHNVAEARSIEVERSDGQKFVANLKFTDPRTDLALLKIETKKQPFVHLAGAELPQIGQPVYAVGSTGPLDFSYADGVVSGLDRRIGAIESPRSIERFIQTNVPLNPGCSGGPLLNAKGELLGINTAIWSVSGRFEGYSFAIPSVLLRDFLQKYFSEKNLCQG